MTPVHPLVRRAVAFVTAFAAVFAISQAAARPALAHNVDSWDP